MSERLKEALNLFQESGFNEEIAFPERSMTPESILQTLPFTGTGELDFDFSGGTEGLEGENNQPPGDMNPGVH